MTARALAATGARVLVHGRNPDKVAATVAEVGAGARGRVEGVVADFASLAEVRRMAAEVLARTDRLDLLVNNAGGAAVKRELTVDGFERTFATNHLAPFLLTNLLLDLIRRSSPARIVTVASEAHRAGGFHWDDLQNVNRYRGFQVYGQTKRQNVMFALALARRLAGTGVTSTVMHPGVVDTGIWSAATGPVGVVIRVMQWFMLSPERGAAPLIRLATDPALDWTSGVYFDRFKPRAPHAAALDVEAQERLWTESARLAGVGG